MSLIFQGVTEIGKPQFTTELTHNIAMWLNWSFLNIGGFSNISLSQSGVYGGDFSRLRAVSDPYSTNYQVFEGVRSNWVYESGIQYSTQPTHISGVYVNGTFVTSGFTINYPLGQIKFTNAKTSSDIVKCEYAYKFVKIESSEVPWTQTVLFDSFRVDNTQFLSSSGVWNTLSQSRIQLPAIIIEPTINVRYRGVELGGGQFRTQDVYLHVISETAWDRNNLADILLNQREKVLIFYDVNLAAINNKLPITFNGTIVPSSYMYPQLITQYPKRQCFIKDVSSESWTERNGTHRAVIRWSCDIQMDEI